MKKVKREHIFKNCLGIITTKYLLFDRINFNILAFPVIPDYRFYFKIVKCGTFGSTFGFEINDALS